MLRMADAYPVTSVGFAWLSPRPAVRHASSLSSKSRGASRLLLGLGEFAFLQVPIWFITLARGSEMVAHSVTLGALGALGHTPVFAIASTFVHSAARTPRVRGIGRSAKLKTGSFRSSIDHLPYCGARCRHEGHEGHEGHAPECRPKNSYPPSTSST